MSEENDSSSSTIQSLKKETKDQTSSLQDPIVSPTSPTSNSISPSSSKTTSPITSNFNQVAPFVPLRHLSSNTKSLQDCKNGNQESSPHPVIEEAHHCRGLNSVVELRNWTSQTDPSDNGNGYHPQNQSPLDCPVGRVESESAVNGQTVPRKQQEPSRVSNANWVCISCSYRNLNKALICVACYTPRHEILSITNGSIPRNLDSSSTSSEERARSNSPSKTQSSQNLDLSNQGDLNGLGITTPFPCDSQSQSQPRTDSSSKQEQPNGSDHAVPSQNLSKWSGYLPPPYQQRNQAELEAFNDVHLTEPSHLQTEAKGRSNSSDALRPNPYSPNSSWQLPNYRVTSNNSGSSPRPNPSSSNSLPFSDYQRSTWVSAPYSAGNVEKNKPANGHVGRLGNQNGFNPISMGNPNLNHFNAGMNQASVPFIPPSRLPPPSNGHFNSFHPVHNYTSAPNMHNAVHPARPEFFPPPPPSSSSSSSNGNFQGGNLINGASGHGAPNTTTSPTNHPRPNLIQANGNPLDGNVNKDSKALATALQLSAIGVGIGPGVNPSLAEGKPNNSKDRPSIINTGNSGPMQLQFGDWICSSCGFVNWRRRKVCMRCFPFSDEAVSASFTDGAILAAQLAAGVDPDPSQLAALTRLSSKPRRDESRAASGSQPSNLGQQHQQHQFQQHRPEFPPQQSHAFQVPQEESQSLSQMPNGLQTSNFSNHVPFNNSPISISASTPSSSRDNSVFSPLSRNSLDTNPTTEFFKSSNSFEDSFSQALNLDGISPLNTASRPANSTNDSSSGSSRESGSRGLSRSGTESSIYAPGNVERLQSSTTQRQFGTSNDFSSPMPSLSFFPDQSAPQRSTHSMTSAGSLPLPIPKLSSSSTPASMYESVHASQSNSGSNDSPTKSCSIWFPKPVSPPRVGSSRGNMSSGSASETESNGKFLSPIGTRASTSTSSQTNSFSSSLNSTKGGSELEERCSHSWNLSFDAINQRTSTPTSLSQESSNNSASSIRENQGKESK